MNMKKVLFTLMVGILCISCNKYDDLYNMIYNLDGRVSELEANTEALEIITEVLESRDYVVSVTPIKYGSSIVGYTLIFAKNGSINIFMGNGDSTFFSNVEYDNNFLFLTLADGKLITLPRTGQGGSSNIKVVTLTINQEDWYYSNIDNNNYFYCEFDMPEITEKAFDEGLIKMYRVYDYDTYDATQIEMPYVRLNEFCAGDVDGDGYDDWGFYTETVDYQFNIGSLMVCYTTSDFDYELNEEYIPEAMQFRCVILQ